MGPIEEPTPPGRMTAVVGYLTRAAGWVKRNHPFLAWCYAVVVSLWLAFLFVTGKSDVPPPLPPPPPPILGESPDLDAIGMSLGQGWAPDPDATNTDAAMAKFKNFADTQAGQVPIGDLPQAVYLWQAYTQLTGKPTPLKDQNPTGSCVGFGSTTAIERSEAVEIVHRKGSAAEMALFSEEVTYAGSKVEGARALGASVSRSDGSAGVFVKAFLQSYGMAPKQKYASCDLTVYDAARARSWNTSGPPKDVLDATKKYPVGDAAKVTSWAQCKQALASGYGVAVCANWKYSAKRDANGVAQDLGRGWNHCMCCDGYIVVDSREYGHIENSWSNLPDRNGNRTGQPYHTGPVGWGNPTTAGFWATSESIDRALKQNDSFAYSRVTGFPARVLKWRVQKPAPFDLTRVLRCDGFALAF